MIDAVRPRQAGGVARRPGLPGGLARSRDGGPSRASPSRQADGGDVAKQVRGHRLRETLAFLLGDHACDCRHLGGLLQRRAIPSFIRVVGTSIAAGSAWPSRKSDFTAPLAASQGFHGSVRTAGATSVATAASTGEGPGRSTTKLQSRLAARFGLHAAMAYAKALDGQRQPWRNRGDGGRRSKQTARHRASPFTVPTGVWFGCGSVAAMSAELDRIDDGRVVMAGRSIDAASSSSDVVLAAPIPGNDESASQSRE